jgi:hypothetical protein
MHLYFDERKPKMHEDFDDELEDDYPNYLYDNHVDDDDMQNLLLGILAIALVIAAVVLFTAGILATILTNRLGYGLKGLLALAVFLTLGFVLPARIFGMLNKKSTIQLSSLNHEVIAEED